MHKKPPTTPSPKGNPEFRLPVPKQPGCFNILDILSTIGVPPPPDKHGTGPTEPQGPGYDVLIVAGGPNPPYPAPESNPGEPSIPAETGTDPGTTGPAEQGNPGTTEPAGQIHRGTTPTGE